MNLLNTLIFVLLTTNAAIGQAAQADSFLTKVKSAKVNIYDRDFMQASKGAENFIDSLLGDTYYHNHIKVNIGQTEKGNFQVYVGKSGDAKLLESHDYYSIHYYVVDNQDTLSYFELLVDSIGRPTQFDKDFSYSSPIKLILSFKKLFPNKFKVDFAKATEIVKQQGFNNKPFLNYHTDGDKDGFYWRVSSRLADGKRRVFDINADTGKTLEFYFPGLEE